MYVQLFSLFLIILLFRYRYIQYLINIWFSYIFRIFPNNMKINNLYTSKDATYHSIQIRHMLCAYILSATSRLILYSASLIRPFPPSLPVFYASLSFSSILFLVIVACSSFLRNPLYIVCIYFTARRKTSHPLPTSLPHSSWTGDCHSPLGMNVITASEPVVACTSWL